ncbi:putative indolepyruvate oxidoreductase subunit B [Xylanimonas cellulosilytica DSM 15894]|uniref:Indolepyruvate oxidoreductase subunit B n=1 Tax=Xylanimonas cellulosilytica (strain DSM 15894 / JCM 12276 / CECT 5975 / KCTC 9989 / LMG 20990 / NBRC 107835 / XIL07) TaxID=446471 RepID=D1BV83_XYLCX|nr:indolepyruvate oxidoreductase subunit beta family protein [Xylanimonas cellulosilytica]ACZ29354.1 putative indolepyruvate oxidoreductase subunit B [Xylanimonas cellulosilytica DSM 15894]
MSSWSSGRRPITIAILAMGGEGGGVLADWIVAVGENAGYHSQNTSVAGVAQRTGATVYYVELYPGGRSQGDDVRREPVLSLFPTPGEVDIVIASELMEAGRAIQRGFSTPDRTTLIASTNRVYSMDEKLALGDGRVDSNTLLEAAHAGAKHFIGADFMELALAARSVISASLFGALAGSGALPFDRTGFEDAIRASGKGVDASLAAFAAGYDAAQRPAPLPLPAAPTPASGGPVAVTIGLSRPVDPAEEAATAAEKRREEQAVRDPGALVGAALQHAAARVTADFPAPARSMLLHGVVRTAVYQDTRYTDAYLDRVARFAAVERPDGPARLTTEAARHIALWMCYQDTIQVAQQKIRRRRLDGVRTEAKAAPGQLLNVREYLHPQVEEIADTLPTALGRWVAGSAWFGKAVGRLTRNGMIVNTTGIIGFTMLWAMAMFRPLRPRSLRFGREQAAIDAWLDQALAAAAIDYDLACEIVECQRVLKGYGATHQHGTESFAILLAEAAALAGRPDAAATLVRLRDAALADEDGSALQQARAELASGAPVPELSPVA